MPRRGQYSPLDDSSSSGEEEESSILSEAMREHQNQIMMAYHLGLLDCSLDRLPKEVWKHVLQNDLFIDVCNWWPTLSSDLENKMYMRYFRVDKQTFDAIAGLIMVSYL